MLTGDENIIDINFVMRWRIGDAGDFRFNIRNPETTVKAAAESVMREMVGQTPIEAALTEARGQIEEQGGASTQAMMDEYGAGILIDQVQLQKADPPAEVIDAFRDVQRAAADRERQRNEAEAYRNDIIPRARGEAERLIQEARARTARTPAPPARRALRSVLARLPEGPGRHRAAPLPRDHGGNAAAERRSSRKTGCRAWCLTCRCPSCQRAGGPSGRRRRCPRARHSSRQDARLQGCPPDEPPRGRRRPARRPALRRRLLAIRRASDPAGADHAVRQAGPHHPGSGPEPEDALVQTVISFDRRLLDFDAPGAGGHPRRPAAARGRHLHPLTRITDPLRSPDGGRDGERHPPAARADRLLLAAQRLGNRPLLAVLSADRARIMGRSASR